MIEVEISVTVHEPDTNRRTYLETRTFLPCAPPLGSMITVLNKDEAVPLRVDGLELIPGRAYVFAAATPHHLERIEDGRPQRVPAAEIIQMLVAAGFQVGDVVEGDKSRGPPHASKTKT